MKKNKLIALTVALASVVGFSAVNVNAATACVDTLPETVTRNALASNYKIDVPGFNASEEKTDKIVEFLSNDNKYLLYCSDRNNPNIDSAVTLTKGSQMDYKIAYVLTHGYSKQKLIDGIGDTLAPTSNPSETAQAGRGNDMANLWITQVAIWNLQNTFASTELNNDEIKYTVNNLGFYKLTTDSTNRTNLLSTTLWKHVETLVAGANSAKDPAVATLSVTGDTKWTKSDNISKSGLITVVPSSNLAKLSTYGVSLENAPEGTKLYTEDGTDITNNSSSIPGGKKIYITVDNNKIDKAKEYNFKINATGKITYDAAYQYVDNSNQCGGKACQPSVLVGPANKDVNGSIDIKIIPDTASSLSKTIYYIGFIILLSGAGIIYANIRPRKQEAE